MAAASTDERDKCHTALTELLGEGGALSSPPDELHRYFDDYACVRFAKRYRAQQRDVRQHGKAVVVSAGPPGAGKSRVLKTMPLTGFRHIDPDEIKDLLLVDADNHGLLRYREGFSLPDSEPVMLRELAGHVHQISTRVADFVLDMSLSLDENVVIDGSLTWHGLPDDYVRQFADAQYSSVQVIDVEAPMHLAIEGARTRWWRDRKDDALGGRFIADSVIEAKYDHPDISIAAKNARRLAELAGEQLGVGELVSYEVGFDGKPVQSGYERFEIL